jgi:hypothetical protein
MVQSIIGFSSITDTSIGMDAPENARPVGPFARSQSPINFGATIMNDLVNLVAQRVGISPDQARTAVDTVLGFLKNKMPGPIAGQLDNLAAGRDGAASDGGLVDQIKAGVGGLLGGK